MAKGPQRLLRWMLRAEQPAPLDLDHPAQIDIAWAADRIEKLEAKCARLQSEAESHAMEARTANSTIADIYQAITGATGEPGNWNGAEPVRAVVAKYKRLREALVDEVSAMIDEDCFEAYEALLKKLDLHSYAATKALEKTND